MPALEWPFPYADNVRSIRKQFPADDATHFAWLAAMASACMEYLNEWERM